MQNGLGFYLRHCKERVVIAFKNCVLQQIDELNVIFSPRLSNAQKPAKLYQLLENLHPTAETRGELFGNMNNLRIGWNTIGNFN